MPPFGFSRLIIGWEERRPALLRLSMVGTHTICTLMEDTLRSWAVSSVKPLVGIDRKREEDDGIVERRGASW